MPRNRPNPPDELSLSELGNRAREGKRRVVLYLPEAHAEQLKRWAKVGEITQGEQVARLVEREWERHPEGDCPASG